MESTENLPKKQNFDAGLKLVSCKKEKTFSAPDQTPKQKSSEEPSSVAVTKPQRGIRVKVFKKITRLKTKDCAGIGAGGVSAEGVTSRVLPQGSSVVKEEPVDMSKDPPPPSSQLGQVGPPSSPPSGSPPPKRAREDASDGSDLGLQTPKTANVNHFDHLDGQSLDEFENVVSRLSTLSENFVRHVKTLEQKVGWLEAVEAKSKEEISHLKQDLESVTKDRQDWMVKFINEASTGREFHQSKAGQKLLEDTKRGHLDKFKKSRTFKRLVADEAASICDRTLQECRNKLKEKGQSPNEDSSFSNEDLF